MLFHFIDITSNILEILVAVSFFELVVTEKKVCHSVRNLCLIGAIIARCIISFNVQEEIIIAVLAWGLYIIILLLYKVGLVKSIFISFFAVIIFVLSEIIIGLILTVSSGMTVELLTYNVFFYMQGALMSKLIDFVIVKAISYFSKPSDIGVPNSMYIVLMIHPIATFLIIFLMSEFMYETYDMSSIGICVVAVTILIFSNFLMLYLFEYYQKITEEKMMQQMLKQDLEYKLKYYKELSDRQKVSNKTMHDLKNQLFALRESLQLNVDDGIKKINDICDNILCSKTLVYTGNEAIDALITVKSQSMKEKNINFNFSIFVAKDNKFKSYDMCILLGNLLDNAIEASEKINEDKRSIFLDMKQSEEYLCIQISNVVSGEIMIQNNKIMTSKTKKELHGFGLKSVVEIVKKYNGDCIFKQEGENFKIILRLENK